MPFSKFDPKIRKKVERLLKMFTVLSLVGVIVSSYLLYAHFKPDDSTICNIGDYLNCDVINKSIYSDILGIPVALIGAIGYLLLFLIAYGMLLGFYFRKIHKSLRPKIVLQILTTMVIFAVAFSIWLTYIEFFVLFAACIFCLTQQLIIILLLFIVLYILTIVRKWEKDGGELEFPQDREDMKSHS